MTTTKVEKVRPGQQIKILIPGFRQEVTEVEGKVTEVDEEYIRLAYKRANAWFQKSMIQEVFLVGNSARRIRA